MGIFQELRAWFTREHTRRLHEIERELDEFVAQCKADMTKLRAEYGESVPAKRIEALERDLCDLRDLHDELHRAHVRLRSRQGMREAREKANGSAGQPRTVDELREELERKHGIRK